jgi:hypothetical protein
MISIIKNNIWVISDDNLETNHFFKETRYTPIDMIILQKKAMLAHWIETVFKVKQTTVFLHEGIV